MRIDAVLRRNPALDLTLVAGPWDARIVERVSVIDDTARIATARRGELVVLTRRASRSASGRGLIQLLEAAGEHELAALALYGRATTSQAVIAAASGARVALLAIGIGEDPAALALALEAALHADADAVLRRLTAALSAIEHAEPDGTEAILVAASAALDAEVSIRDGVVSADREDTAVRIGCRLVADAVTRAASHLEPPVSGRVVVLVEPAGGDGGDLVVLEGLRVGREAGWQAKREGDGVRLSGDGDGAVVAAGLIERLPVSVVCGVGGDWSEARTALARARAAHITDVPFRYDAADPDGLVLELAGSPAARSSATGLLAPLERLGGQKATAAIHTLRVYLDCWGSLARSGEILHLHPNAVAHRMKRIRAVLPADLDDPDQRLALQIACRARTPRP
ncbi:MAG: helix-turn-helix domain-containing protein [Solirubrobacterales bacterium]